MKKSQTIAVACLNLKKNEQKRVYYRQWKSLRGGCEMECYFPIDKIHKKSRVSIWGGGELGKQLIEWNKRFHYCDIICVFDKNKSIIVPDDVEITQIERWQEYDFDKVIVTIIHKLDEIRKICNENGIPLEKCIFLAEGDYINYKMTSKTSYSQEGEDIIICNLLKRLNRQCISFCDIGANDPYLFSNTYLLERTFQIGRGVLVEPNPLLAKKIKNERPKSLCVNCGITDTGKEEALNFFVMSADTLSSFSRDEVNEYEKIGYLVEAEELVVCKDINDVLEKCFDGVIDVISIDTEGFDLRIVKKLNFEKYRPLILCIETCGFNSGKDEDGLEIIKYMEQIGYFVYADTFINTIFVDKQIMEQCFCSNFKTIYPFVD